MRFGEPVRLAEQIPKTAGIKDRRRPGRVDLVCQHLISLLRNPATVDILALQPDKAHPSPSRDDLAHLKGFPVSLAVSFVLGVPLWAWIVGIVRAALR